MKKGNCTSFPDYKHYLMVNGPSVQYIGREFCVDEKRPIKLQGVLYLQSKNQCWYEISITKQ